MAADYSYLSASNGSGDAALMHVNGGGRTIGSTVIPVDSVVNVPTKFIGTYGVVGSNGLITTASKRDFKGHVSGATLVIDAFQPGSTDNGNNVGDVVLIKPNTSWADDIVTLAKVTHNDDGTLKTSIVDTGMIASLAVNNSKLAPDISPVKFANPYKFGVYRAAALTPGAAAVIFDTEEFDTSNNYSTVDGKFTAPVAGFYQFNAALTATFTAANTAMGCALLKNGSTYKIGSVTVVMYAGTYNTTANVSSLIQLAVGDYVQVGDPANSGKPLAGTITNNYFNGFLVSTT